MNVISTQTGRMLEAENSDKTGPMRFRISIALLGVLFCMSGSGATTNVYTAAGSVNDVLSGDLSVQVKCPAKQFVTFTQDNNYSGTTEILSGGVIIKNIHSLGKTGRIKCSSETAIRIMVSYRDAGVNMKELLLDRIEVEPAADGSTPWVSIQVAGEGLKNDIDFTGQPYLWLGAPKDQRNLLNGIYEPADHVYRFGHFGLRSIGDVGIWVTNLVDAADGTPRKVHCQGMSTVFLNKITGARYNWSGGTMIEDDCCCTVSKPEDLGNFEELNPECVVIRNAILRIQSTNVKFKPTQGMKIDGNARIALYGSREPVQDEWAGPLSGSGRIDLSDIGGISFPNSNNTFDGEVALTSANQMTTVDLELGHGTNLSWKGSRITTVVPNQRIVLHSDGDHEFHTALEGPGALVKRGSGQITLTKGASLQGAQHFPVLQIDEGSIRLGEPMANEVVNGSGFMTIERGASLDLGWIPVEALPVPVGEGQILNIATSRLIFSGSPEKPLPFNGKMTPSCDIEINGRMTTAPWILGPFAKFGGNLFLNSGTFALDYGSRTEGYITLGENARLIMDGHKNQKGLKAKYWWQFNKGFHNDGSTNDVIRLHKVLLKTEPSKISDLTRWGAYMKSGDLSFTAAQDALEPLALEVGTHRDSFAAQFEGFFFMRSRKVNTNSLSGK